MMDIERIKAANPIEKVIEESGHELEGRGRQLQGVKHDSLKVRTDWGYYEWFSKGGRAGGHSGDVIAWLMNERQMGFREAVEFLARRADITVEWNEAGAAAWQAARMRMDTLSVVAEFLRGKLRASAAAMKWAAARGWSEETLAEAGCGYWDGDWKGLRGWLEKHGIDVERPEAVAVVGFRGDVQAWAKKWGVKPDVGWLKEGRIGGMPPGMFVYAHLEFGKVGYLSGRSIEGKRHWNLHSSLVGEKRPYWNWVYGTRAKHVVVVEGQADAVTLGQWDVAAVALCHSRQVPEGLDARLKGHDYVYVALDRDEAGVSGAEAVAEGLGPMTRIVSWPDEEGVKDANDWLVNGGTADGCLERLAESGTFVEWLAERVDLVKPLDQEEAKRRAIAAMVSMPNWAFEEKKKHLAKAMFLSQTVLGRMVRELRKEEEAKKKKVSDIKKEIIAPNGYLDGHMFEMVYEAEHEDGPRTRLAVRYPDGVIKVVRSFETDSYRVLAPDPWDTLLQKNVLRLATHPADYEDEVLLQERIQSFIHKYIDLPESFEVLASYYVMLSWMFDLFYVLPYLRARGMSDSGKSRFISVIGNLCFRACFVTGSTTPSPVFRKIQEWNGLTLVMDEADLPHTDTSAEWIQMFNVGYKKEFAILRTAMTMNGAVVEAFSAFGPKILNMRGKFADDATESRCLTWETSAGRAIRKDIPRYIVDMDGFHEEAQAIRNMCLKWRLERWRDIKVDYNHEGTMHMPGRLVEITVPLMSITDSREFKDKLMEHIEEMSRQAVVERSSTLAAKVFEALLMAKHLPDEKALELPDELLLQVAHVTRQANRLIDRENAEALADGEDPEHKKRLSAGYVGKLLNNELNLTTDKATIGTRPKVVIWDLERVEALVIRYGLEDVLVELIDKGQQAAAKRAAEAEKDGKQGRIVL